MSDTPRTDAIPHNVADLAMHSRKLEREIDALRKDKERLDWVLNNYTLSCGITREEVDEKMAELGKWAKSELDASDARNGEDDERRPRTPILPNLMTIGNR